MVLIWLQLAIGLLTITQTLQHMDGAEMVRFMTWSQSVLTWNINAWSTVVDVHWLYKLHIFLGLIDHAALPVHAAGAHVWSGFARPSATCWRGRATRSCARAAAVRWRSAAAPMMRGRPSPALHEPRTPAE